MKINKIYNLFILSAFFSFSWINAQSQWIEVRGKSNKEILKLIQRETDKIKRTYDDDEINQVFRDYENEDRKSVDKFSSNDSKYSQAVLHYLSRSNEASSNRLGSITDLQDLRTTMNSQIQLINDQDSTISAQKAEIARKKNETFQDISQIEFYTVALSIIEDVESVKQTNYFPIMDYQIAREAANQKLGSEIVNLSLVKNGVLEKEKVQITLQGKANLDLVTMELPRENHANKQVSDEVGVIFDDVRYGIVAISPFDPEKDNKYLRKPKTPRVKRGQKQPKIETYVGMDQLENYFSGKFDQKRYKYDNTKYKGANLIADEIIKQIKQRNNTINRNNKKSEIKIKSLGTDAKKFIDARQRSIKNANSDKEMYQGNLNSIKPKYAAAFQDSIQTTRTNTKASADVKYWREASILHKQREQLSRRIIVKYDKDVYDDTGNKKNKAIQQEINNLVKDVTQTIINEKTSVEDGNISDEILTRKTSAVLTSFKIIGKYTDLDEKTFKTSRGIGIAVKYGFNFDRVSTLKTLPPPPDLFGENESTDLDDSFTDNNETNSLESEMDAIRQQAMAAANMPAKTAVKKTPKVTVSKKANNIRFTSSPRADVYISGKKIGKTPLDYYLDPSGPHGIVLKKRGYKELSDVVSVSATTKVTKDYEMNKNDQEVKSAGFPRWVIYAAVLGGGAAVALGGSKKDAPKTGSLSVSINIPN